MKVSILTTDALWPLLRWPYLMLILDVRVPPEPSSMYSSQGCALESFKWALNAECSDWNLDQEGAADPVLENCL